MSIISQLIQFIFRQREVKDIDYNPRYAAIAILGDALPMVLFTIIINESGLDLGDARINHISAGVAITYAAVFTALFYSFFAAQEKQARFVQAATAFFGASLILTVVNMIIAPLPGADILTFVILGLKISCAIRVTTESLGYSIVRSVFSLLGISMMALFVATTLFPVDIVQTAVTNQ